jgi:hypothetical protein
MLYYLFSSCSLSATRNVLFFLPESPLLTKVLVDIMSTTWECSSVDSSGWSLIIMTHRSITWKRLSAHNCTWLQLCPLPAIRKSLIRLRAFWQGPNCRKCGSTPISGGRIRAWGNSALNNLAETRPTFGFVNQQSFQVTITRPHDATYLRLRSSLLPNTST